MLKAWPWLGAAGALILGILLNRLKDWLGKGLDALAKSAYTQLAGSALLRRTALKKYTRELYRRHQEFSVSFRGDILKMKMASVYVPLTVAARRGAEDRRLDAATTLRNERRSVVLGVPGAGKTMLLRRTVLFWAARRCRVVKRHPWSRRTRIAVNLGRLDDIPILLELHRCNDADTSLEDHLIDHFRRHDFPNAARFVRRALQEGQLAVYFDGLDEVASTRRGEVSDLIKEFAENYRKCRVVVTCRVAVYEDQFAQQFDQTLQIADFDEQLIRRFLGGWPWPESLAEGTVERLMTALRETRELMLLARNPLLLTMIAYLYSYEYAGTDQALPYTRAEFYKQVTDSLLGEWQRQQNRFPKHVKRAVLQQLALAAQDTPPTGIDRLALPENRVRTDVGEALTVLGRNPDSADDVLTEIVQRSGLLLAVDGGERYQFAHLTLQEYLAAVQLADDPGGLLRRYRKDPTMWRESVRLWCSEVSRDSTDVIRGVFASDTLLAFECLTDAHQVDGAVADGIVRHFQDQLAEAGQDRQMAAAFGLVAADRRPRGTLVFRFLADVATTPATAVAAAARRDAAIGALAATNRPEAVEVLAPLFTVVSSAEAALVRMGDLAVPALHRAARTGSQKALTALWMIRTPAAALAMTDLLWMGDADLEATAAAYLGEMLTNPQIEDVLRTTATPPGGEYIDWVWKPFATGPGDPLIRIAGRIALLLDRHEQIPDVAPSGIDPRIGIPLCTVLARSRESIRYFVKLPPEIIEKLTTVQRRLRDGHGSSLYGVSASLVYPDGATNMRRVSELLNHAGDSASGAEAESLAALGVEILRMGGLSGRAAKVFNLLSPELRLSVVAARLGPGELNADKWKTVRDAGTYSYSTSWHYRAVLLLAFAVSAVATFGAVAAGMGWHPWGPSWLDWTCTGLIVFGWGALLFEGVLTEPSILGDMGVAGLLLAFLEFFDGDFATVMTAGLAPAAGFFWFITVMGYAGLWVAIGCSVAVLSLGIGLAVRGTALDSRAHNPLREIYKRATGQYRAAVGHAGAIRPWQPQIPVAQSRRPGDSGAPLPERAP